MNITVISSPAPCRRRLIEALRSTIKNGVIRMERHSARFLVRLATKVCTAIVSRVPGGYADETGFHRDVVEVPSPAIGSSRIRHRLSGKGCLQGRWKAMRILNLNSGRQLVLQWDSSSLPPFRLSPELLSFQSRKAGPNIELPTSYI